MDSIIDKLQKKTTTSWINTNTRLPLLEDGDGDLNVLVPHHANSSCVVVYFKMAKHYPYWMKLPKLPTE